MNDKINVFANYHDGKGDKSTARITAFHSDVFSSRTIGPDGVWKIHVWQEGSEQALITLNLTDEMRDALIHMLTHRQTEGERLRKWMESNQIITDDSLPPDQIMIVKKKNQK